MTESAGAYQTILRQARRLPVQARRDLAEALLRPARQDEEVVVVAVRRLDVDTQARLHDLMQRNNEGELAAEEYQELAQLVERYEGILLANTEALLRANHPDLFDKAGRLKPRRLSAALRKRIRSISSDA